MEKKKKARLNWNLLRKYIKNSSTEELSKKFNSESYPLYNKYKNSNKHNNYNYDFNSNSLRRP